MNEYHASFSKKNGYDNWTLPTGENISLKSSEKRISFEEFEMIFEASVDKVKKYNIYSKGTPKEIARYNVSSNSLELIKDLIVDYMNSIKQFNANPTKLAFDWSVNKIRVWAEIKDNDEATENALILSEARANAINKNIGVYITTTIVEDSDKLPIPPHYISIL